MFEYFAGKVTRSVGVAAGAAFGVALAVSSMMQPARAGGPLPYDGPAPPPNVSVAFLYNQFASASTFYTANGTKLGNTHIQTDVPVLRFVHTFSPIDGMPWGVQVIAPYVSFLGNQEVGGGSVSHQSGFAEPQLSAFLYPVNHPSQDETVVLAYFLSPPSGSYNPSIALNASTNNWVNNFEIGYMHKVFGQAKGKRLDLEVWADGYFYGNTNVQTGVHLKTDPAAQFIVYAPYYFHPQTDAYVGLSFEKTFGGKISEVNPLGTFDTGSRNNFTRIGVIAGSFLSPTIFAQAQLATDVQARGGAKNDIFFQVQVGKVF